MSARSVSAGSQPAIEVACDFEGCYVTSREFVDDKRRARESVAQQGWRSDIRDGFAASDYCPQHVAELRASGTRSDIDTHGPWDKAQERYEDGTESHSCTAGCAYGHVGGGS